MAGFDPSAEAQPVSPVLAHVVCQALDTPLHRSAHRQHLPLHQDLDKRSGAGPERIDECPEMISSRWSLTGLPLGNAADGSDVLGDPDARVRDGPQIFFGPIIAEPTGSMSPRRRMKRVC